MRKNGIEGTDTVLYWGSHNGASISGWDNNDGTFLLECVKRNTSISAFYHSLVRFI